MGIIGCGHPGRGEARDHIRGLPSILSARNPLQSPELIFATYESARLRERVTLPLEGVQDHPFLDILREHDVMPPNTLIN